MSASQQNLWLIQLIIVSHALSTFFDVWPLLRFASMKNCLYSVP
jgi:hypothetical protein